MSELAKVGDFCPNEACADFGKRQGDHQRNLIKYGTSKAGRQRYRCTTCDGTFTETKGTLFYGKRTPATDIIRVLAMLAEGSRISSVARITGHKADTILAWLREAAHHVAAIESALLAAYRLSRGQLDGLWAYVGNKGEKNTIQKPMCPGNSGALP